MPEINPEEFAIPFFTQQNFTRRKCPNCGSYFWGQNPNQTTCGEAPCAPYTSSGIRRRKDDTPCQRCGFSSWIISRPMAIPASRHIR